MEDISLTDVRAETEYTFRLFEPGDTEGYLSLYETVYGERHTRDWFRWRFEDNPYVNHIPIFVAVSDGDIVATRPFFALRMSVGGEEMLALLTVDTMVHPDHRRRGLFTMATKQSLEYYTTREPAFVFNEPNPTSRSGYLQLGWQEVGPSVKFYRIQRPELLLAERLEKKSTRWVAPLTTALADTYLGTRDVLRNGNGGDAVRKFRGVKHAELARLYRQRPPNAIHAIRDEPYYRWRFASPEWSRTTYLVETDECTVGALTRTRTTHEGVTVTQVADVVPLVGGEGWRGGVAALFERIVDDHRDSNLIAAIPKIVPADLLTRFGFLPDDRMPLSRLSATKATLCVRPLTADGRTRADNLLYDPSQWLLSYGERDTV